ncbi:MAG: DUF4296 domain-containing protein [Bacteroidetes bacterium]|nr:DUF4296 domain-containing protein [Bacteroidota bacterium]
MQKFFSFILVLFIFVSCSSKKTEKIDDSIEAKEIIPENQMIAILTDMHLAESATMLAQGQGKDIQLYTNHYYKEILAKNKISKSQLEKSIHYYAFNVKKMDKIYTEVITNLNQK